MQKVLVYIVKALFGLVNALPHRLSLFIAEATVNGIVLLQPSHRQIALRNLATAFPGESEEWRQEVFRKSCRSFARVIIDSIRIQTLDKEWVRKHVKCAFLPRLEELKSSGTGCVLATGHLGSFDLMGHAMPLLGCRIAFVVRNFKLMSLDRFWNDIRGANGNRVISRKGAFRGVMQSVKKGIDTAVLFDQNVRREFAVFVDWFGLPAATTALPAIVVLRTGGPLVVASMAYLGDDMYEIDAVECDISDIRNNTVLKSDEKVRLVTERASKEYEKMIRRRPHEWFWMHRRWKTRPAGEPEKFYK